MLGAVRTGHAHQRHRAACSRCAERGAYEPRACCTYRLSCGAAQAACIAESPSYHPHHRRRAEQRAAVQGGRERVGQRHAVAAACRRRGHALARGRQQLAAVLLTCMLLHHDTP